MSVKISILEQRTTKELYQYIQPETRFVAQAVQFAFDILAKRGEIFDEAEAERINTLIAHKKLKEQQELIKEEPWDKNAVKEEIDAIQLFSQLAIWGFSIAFGVIFGSVLLAFNFKILQKNKVAIGTIAFGILYTIVQILLLSYLDENNMSFRNQTYLVSGIGACVLHYFFWETYISNQLKYKKKSILFPLAICLLIYIPIFFILLSGY